MNIDYFHLRLIAITLAVVLYFIYWYRRPRRCPPGPRGIPILGYIPFLGNWPEKTLFKLSQKYGKILTVRMGAEDVIFLNDYESIHAVSILIVMNILLAVSRTRCHNLRKLLQQNVLINCRLQ